MEELWFAIKQILSPSHILSKINLHTNYDLYKIFYISLLDKRTNSQHREF